MAISLSSKGSPPHIDRNFNPFITLIQIIFVSVISVFELLEGPFSKIVPLENFWVYSAGGGPWERNFGIRVLQRIGNEE
jgi:hypothetical protein